MANVFYASRGDIAVCVQHPITLPVIKFRQPDRYADVFSISHSQIWGMLADAARFYKDGDDAGAPGKARRAYLTGYSFTGAIVMSFAKRHHRVNRMPRGGPLFDGYVAGTGGGPMPPMDAPVLVGDNQHSSYPEADKPVRQAFDADGAMTRRRRYEIVGYEHNPLPEHEPGSALPPPRSLERERQCSYQYPQDAVHNPNLVGRPIVEGMFRNISDWVENGVAPPRAPLIQSEDGKPKLDSNGNALGGVRLPDITVPIGSYGIGVKECASTGWMIPFMQDHLRRLYGSRENYLRLYGDAADRMTAERYILTARAERMKLAAAAAAPSF